MDAPCAWNRFLAGSRPIMLVSLMDALLIAVFQHRLPSHIDFSGRGSIPSLTESLKEEIVRLNISIG